MIVKVCGVRSAAIAEAALDAGADWIGIVDEPRSPRHASAGEAAEVAAACRGRGTLVVVMVDATPARCEAAVDRYDAMAVQAHGVVDPRLAVESPVPLIPALNLPVADLLVAAWWPDCLLLVDAPAAGNGLPGGTGLRVDVDAAAALARHRPILLAGGLHPGNVGAAVATVRPRGVDASSGLESSPGIKDRELVVAYVQAARAAATTAAGTPA